MSVLEWQKYELVFPTSVIIYKKYYIRKVLGGWGWERRMPSFQTSQHKVSLPDVLMGTVVLSPKRESCDEVYEVNHCSTQ